MKKLILIVAIFLIYASVWAQGLWRIDNSNSNLNFMVQWRQNSFRTGEFKIFSGDIRTTQPNFENSEVTFIAEAASIDLIASNLSKLVQSDEFLNVAQYPQISFKSSTLKKKKKNIYELKGTLTITGVSKTQKFILEDHGIVLFEGRSYLLLEVNGELNRSDFKIFGGGEHLGDKIIVTGFFEAVKIE